MLKIGILGSDNRHAERFSELLNLPEHPSFLPDTDARIVAIWGEEAAQTQDVAQQNRTPFTAFSPLRFCASAQQFLQQSRHLGGVRMGAYDYRF